MNTKFSSANQSAKKSPLLHKCEQRAPTKPNQNIIGWYYYDIYRAVLLTDRINFFCQKIFEII